MKNLKSFKGLKTFPGPTKEKFDLRITYAYLVFMSLTPKQQQVLRFINEQLEDRGVSPTLREIAEHFGFSSLGTVQNYLIRLKDHGMIKSEWNGKRSLKPTPSTKMLPLLGRVAAGVPIEAIEIPELIEIPSYLRPEGECFVLEVTGQSMKDDGVYDGDYVIIKKQHSAQNGQTVVALIDNEATIKRYYKHKDYVELRPANPDFKPIVVRSDHFKIEGVVVGLIRNFR